MPFAVQSDMLTKIYLPHTKRLVFDIKVRNLSDPITLFTENLIKHVVERLHNGCVIIVQPDYSCCSMVCNGITSDEAFWSGLQPQQVIDDLSELFLCSVLHRIIVCLPAALFVSSKTTAWTFPMSRNAIVLIDDRDKYIVSTCMEHAQKVSQLLSRDEHIEYNRLFSDDHIGIEPPLHWIMNGGNISTCFDLIS